MHSTPCPVGSDAYLPAPQQSVSIAGEWARPYQLSLRGGRFGVLEAVCRRLGADVERLAAFNRSPAATVRRIAADTIALRRIYADDFFGIGPTGVVRNKAEVIADFTSHALTYQSITTAEVRVRVYGNTAVETGRSTMVGQDRGNAVPRENRFTRVWVMMDGRWQLVANHSS
jgi:ketosteroid isomerase-like protein